MPLTLQEKFDKATAYVQKLPTDGPYQPTEIVKLKYYANYKQGTIGDVNTARPGFLDFVGKAKWDAWNEIKGRSKEDAQKCYVDSLVQDLDKIEAKDESMKKILEELRD